MTDYISSWNDAGRRRRAPSRFCAWAHTIRESKPLPGLSRRLRHQLNKHEFCPQRPNVESGEPAADLHA
jgi:hypothetical protein